MIKNISEIKTAADADLTTSIIAYSDQIEIHSKNFNEKDRETLAEMIEELVNRYIELSLEPNNFDPDDKSLPRPKRAKMILKGLK